MQNSAKLSPCLSRGLPLAILPASTMTTRADRMMGPRRASIMTACLATWPRELQFAKFESSMSMCTQAFDRHRMRSPAFDAIAPRIVHGGCAASAGPGYPRCPPTLPVSGPWPRLQPFPRSWPEFEQKRILFAHFRSPPISDLYPRLPASPLPFRPFPSQSTDLLNDLLQVL